MVFLGEESHQKERHDSKIWLRNIVKSNHLSNVVFSCFLCGYYNCRAIVILPPLG